MSAALEINGPGNSTLPTRNRAAEASKRLADRGDFGIEWFHFSQLNIDPSLQREYDSNRAARIRAAFHSKGLGIPLVARVNGRLLCLDGQTRKGVVQAIAGQIERGEIVAPPGFNDGNLKCEYAGELTHEEAAILFELRNNQKPVSSADINRLRVEQGDEVMNAVVEQASAAGYMVFDNFNPSNITFPQSCIHTARLIVGWGNDTQPKTRLLHRSLLIQKLAFGSELAPIHGTVDRDVLSATAKMLRMNSDAKDTDVMEAMRAFGNYAALRELAIAGRNKRRKKWTVAVSCRHAIVERYNKGRRRGDPTRARP